MKVWMVLALLAVGLGCSEEPPEQWSQKQRQGRQTDCERALHFSPNPLLLADYLAPYLAPGDSISVDIFPDLCRCSLYEMERRYTESELLLLSEEELKDASGWVTTDPADRLDADRTDATSICWWKMFSSG